MGASLAIRILRSAGTAVLVVVTSGVISSLPAEAKPRACRVPPGQVSCSTPPPIAASGGRDRPRPQPPRTTQ
ncbi:MAG: hypothetical protein ACKO21_05380 [Nodosilinea sp.]